jgi:polysaccharide export outer membrane protein
MLRFAKVLAALLTVSVTVQPVMAAESAPAAPSSPAEAAPSAAGPDYIIGPGDELQVFVWGNPDLTVIVPVRPDGKISTPLVEDMGVVGKTPSMLARDIEKVLSEYIRTPQVNIIVTKPASVFSQVKVIGPGVQQQSSLSYREGMTVLDAVLAAGGLTEFARPNAAKVIRTENGRQREIPVRLKRLLEGGDMRENHQLRPGDVLLVPQSRF